MTAEVLVVWIVGAIVGILEVPVFEFLKSKLNVSGKAAFFLVMLFSVVLAFGALFVTGGFSPFVLESLFIYATSIITLSQVTYALWKK
jgi:hypothetical protein